MENGPMVFWKNLEQIFLECVRIALAYGLTKAPLASGGPLNERELTEWLNGYPPTFWRQDEIICWLAHEAIKKFIEYVPYPESYNCIRVDHLSSQWDERVEMPIIWARTGLGPALDLKVEIINFAFGAKIPVRQVS